MNTMLVPVKEMEKSLSVAELNLDYSDTHESFKDLTRLAAKIAGTEISVINLIDLYKQWTVSRYGACTNNCQQEDSISQYAITFPREYMEVNDLLEDDRFKSLDYITGENGLKYYLGIPLQNADGNRFGVLSVMSNQKKIVSSDQIEMLRILADEIVHRLMDISRMKDLQSTIKYTRETHKKVAHDIRGPLGGIVNIAHIIAEQGDSNNVDEMLEVINMIHTSGNSLLEFAEGILTHGIEPDSTVQIQYDNINLFQLKDQLIKLFTPQAIHKDVNLTVNTKEDIPGNAVFQKNELLQITGNLISNAIKYTPCKGNVSVDLYIIEKSEGNSLAITVADTGIGLSRGQINLILKGTSASTNGTDGEQGYGFGLSLVKHLVDNRDGTISIHSEKGKGACFELTLPLNKL